MIRRTPHHTDPRSTHRGGLGTGLGLLLLAPITLCLLSVGATVLAGCSALALLLPALLRKRSRRVQRDDDCIVLDRDQYSRVSDDPVQFPRH